MFCYCLPHLHFDYDFFPYTHLHTHTNVIFIVNSKEGEQKSAKNKVIKIMIRHLHTVLSSRESSHIAIGISMKIISMLTIYISPYTQTHTHKKKQKKKQHSKPNKRERKNLNSITHVF